MNEYCKRLGLLDDQTVPGEKAEYEDYNYARFSVEEDKWMCYKNILTGDAAASRNVHFLVNSIFQKHKFPKNIIYNGLPKIDAFSEISRKYKI